MKSTTITNGLLAIIAVALLWIAFKPALDGRVAIVGKAAAQGETAGDIGEFEAPLQAICTLRTVEEAAARTLTSRLQSEVVSALNQTNEALWRLQEPLLEIPPILTRIEAELQAIGQNTKSY